MFSSNYARDLWIKIKKTYFIILVLLCKSFFIVNFIALNKTNKFKYFLNSN